jgi:hypothetical protein
VKHNEHIQIRADAQENLRPLSQSVLEHAPALLDIIKRSRTYGRRYLPK